MPAKKDNKESNESKQSKLSLEELRQQRAEIEAAIAEAATEQLGPQGEELKKAFANAKAAYDAAGIDCPFSLVYIATVTDIRNAVTEEEQSRKDIAKAIEKEMGLPVDGEAVAETLQGLNDIIRTGKGRTTKYKLSK